MTVNRRLLSLAAGHLVLGIIARLLAPIEIPGYFIVNILVVPLDASVSCQVFLLALLGATSTGSPWGRMAGLMVGAIYLEALLSSILGPELTGISTVRLTVTMAVLLVVRALGVRLIRFVGPAHPAPSETEGFRFSIRGLMLVTAAVALLTTGLSVIREAPLRTILFIVGWGMCFVAVGLLGLWAALGSGRPLWRGTIVVVLSPILGVLFAFLAGERPAVCVYILTLILSYVILLFGSLLVVRSCGYRLVRRTVSSSKAPDEQNGSLPLEIPASGVAAPE